jgi:hypothetical protein
MQERTRRIIPALVAVLVHTVLLAGLLSLRPKIPPPPPHEVLPIAWVERKAAPPSPMGAPGFGLSLPAPPLVITVPDAPNLTAPPDALPSLLGAYIGCGLGQALTEEERARCDQMRHELYANPASKLNPDYELALERRFSRDKAIQDMPALRACFRRSGPDPSCFVPGYEALVGPLAARDPIRDGLFDPLRPPLMP